MIPLSLCHTKKSTATHPSATMNKILLTIAKLQFMELQRDHVDFNISTMINPTTAVK
jgi:hypothetical protein